MKNLVTFVRRLPLRQILTVFLASVMLVVTTACNNGNEMGARPNNPPVQMGGNNNPHTKSGDGYTQYKMSTDPQVKKAQGDRADGQLVAPQLIAANIEGNAGDILYPGKNASSTANPTIGPRGQQTLQKQTQQFPKQRQTVIDRSDPNEKILESIGEQFKESSEFLNDTGDAAVQRPEMQPNPSVNRHSSVKR